MPSNPPAPNPTGSKEAGLHPAAGWALALLLGVVASLVVALPELQALRGGALLGYQNDDWLGAIALHHGTHQALLAFEAPWLHRAFMWPTGMNLLPANGANILEFLLSGLLKALGAEHPLSFTPLLILPLNLLGFVPLGLHLWKRWGPTLAAAMVWTLLPPSLGELATGRMTQALLFALPLVMLALLRLKGGGWRNAVLLGVSGALLALSYWFYAAMAVLCLPLFLIAHRQRGQALLKELLLAAAIAAAITSPWWISLALVGLPSPQAGGLDAAQLSPLFADVLALNGAWPTHLRGWLPAILVPGLIWTLTTRARQQLPWIAMLLLCWVMAMGPAQELGARVWRLPAYPLWRWVPGFDAFHHPDRWLHVAGLPLVVLAFDAAARTKKKGLSLALSALAPVALVVQAFGMGWLPLGTWNPTPPTLWQALDARPETGAILVVPVLQSPLASAWQHHHQRPLMGGVFEAQPWFIDPAHLDAMGRSPLVVSLWKQRGQNAPAVTFNQGDQAYFEQNHIDTVVLDEAAWRKAHGHPSTATRRSITQALGQPKHQDASGAIWVLPPEATQGALLENAVDLRISGPPGPPPGPGAASPKAPGR